MFCINGDGYILSLNQRLQRNQNLLCQTFLYLRPLREKANDAVYLRQANNFVFWDGMIDILILFG